MATLAAVPSSCALASPDPLDRAIQRELAALATIEADHCSACRCLDEWSGPTEVKEHLACRLEARHQTEREAHVLRLAELHQQRMVLALSDAICARSFGRPQVTAAKPVARAWFFLFRCACV